MAGGDSAAAEPRPGESSRNQEKAGTENEAGRQQPELGAQQEAEEKPSPPLPPRPLPPPPKEDLERQPLPPASQGVQFGPQLVAVRVHPADFVRPSFPKWQKATLALGILSLMASAVIFGIGVALGFLNSPYSYRYGDSPVDYEFGTSGAAAGLAILVITVEFLKTWLSKRRAGMHPGALVAFHLIIWLLAAAAITMTAIFQTDDYSWYSWYPSESRAELMAQNSVYEQVLMAFDGILLLVHFILFVGVCCETSWYRAERARQTVLAMRVPGQPDVPVQEGQYPAWPPQSYMPYPGTQPGGYPAPLADRISPYASGGAGPAPYQAPALYGGYYAPTPQGMVWTPHQQGNPVQWQGYYAPDPVPARYSQREPPAPVLAPALASSSGSRRSQRRAQERAAKQAQAIPEVTEPQEQAKPVEPVSEKTT